jgi:hypothetical protein
MAKTPAAPEKARVLAPLLGALEASALEVESAVPLVSC